MPEEVVGGIACKYEFECTEKADKGVVDIQVQGVEEEDVAEWDMYERGDMGER
jgi:hypothetical protein